MKNVLLLRVKPGQKNVEMLTDCKGNVIPSKKIPLDFSKWEMSGKPTILPEIREKYRRGGISFSEQRKLEIKNLKKPQPNLTYIQSAAANGTYEKVINFLLKTI